MQKIVSKYGLAAHLALMTVAPLVLLPFLGSYKTATVLLWLSLFGLMWVLMEPSRRHGEMSHDAKTRVGRAVLRDPLFWFSVVVIAYAGIRALNGGIGLVYDAELMVWYVKEPFLPFLPGCVDGAGYFIFSVLVALAIVFQGVRHAIGRSARIAFLVVASIVSGCAAVAMVFAISFGNPQVMALTGNSFTAASYFGTAFGIQLLCSLIALASVIEAQWVKTELLVAVGLIGNAIGLVTFAPVHTIAMFSVVYLILVVSVLIVLQHRCTKASTLRCFLLVLLSVGAPVMYMLASENSPHMAAKLAAIKVYEVFPSEFFTLRNSLSEISLKTWKDHPWLGTGLDSFPLDIRFAATAQDWEIVPSVQETALCGWWQLITERGVIGVAILVIMVGMLWWTYISRLIRSLSSIRITAEHLIGPAVFIVMIAVSFFDCSLLRPDVFILVGTLLSFSGGAFPEKSVLVGGKGEF